MHIIGKIAINSFYLSSIPISCFFVKETMFHGIDFYANPILASDDWLKTQKQNHIYWQKLDPSLDWKNKKLEDNDVQNAENILTFDNYPEEQEIYQFIQDHTFKLNGPCNNGTGWILDFEIPNDHSYPKTWYIATNMHVVDTYKFLDNDYNVILPIDNNIKFSDVFKEEQKSNIDNSENCKKSFTEGSQIVLEKTTIKIGNTIVVKRSNDLIIQQLNSLPNMKETVRPKLFYHALNFLGPREYKGNWVIKNRDDYFKDFAVLEITFETPAQAKRITDNFYHKYYTNNGGRQRPINVFGPELMSKSTTHKDLWKLETTDFFYSAGYPDGFEPSFVYNFSKNKTTTKVLTPMLDIHNEATYQHNNKEVFKFLQNQHQEPIIGHVVPLGDSTSIDWNHKTKLKIWGYCYAIKNIFSYPGSSGSMIIDKNKNLLGILASGISDKNVGFAEPLNSEGIIDTERRIILPKYDLIRGVSGQTMSYKSQLDKYHPHMNTYLRNTKWGTEKNH